VKILFLCSSLEPGKDGVGDYCRKLASSLEQVGHLAIIIALNDKYLQADTVKEYQYDDARKITVLRHSQSLLWKDKITGLQETINDFDPDWLSFQYVPYGFDIKGLPFYLPKALQQLTGRFKWHFMFHETWAGISNAASSRHKIYSLFQKRIAQDIVASIDAPVITTTNALYQRVLEKKGIRASCLPLFSNISVHAPDEAYIASINEKYSVDLKSDAFYKLGIFGTAYPEASLYTVVPGFIRENNPGKPIILLIFGRNNLPEEIEKLKKSLPANVIFAQLGELNEIKVSGVMGILNQAILCTPFEYIGKSGAYAALRLHNIPVATLSFAPVVKYEKEIRQYNSYLSQRPAAKWSVQYVRSKFIALLKSDVQP
jgi:hypothetical protein